MFSNSPTFPMLAAIRAVYGLMETGQTQKAQDRVQYIVKLFLSKMTSHPIWDAANDAGILRIPLYEDGDEDSRPFVTQICPVWTGPKRHFYLAFHLQLAGFTASPIYYPVVPKGTERIRLMFHAGNTDEEVEALAACICSWAEEMLEIEEGGGDKVPAAARHVHALMAKAGLNPSL
ncbi:hypothetical protein MBLNU459_g3350t2 [Dothideomycetes sp. NU459]